MDAVRDGRRRPGSDGRRINRAGLGIGDAAAIVVAGVERAVRLVSRKSAAAGLLPATAMTRSAEAVASALLL